VNRSSRRGDNRQRCLHQPDREARIFSKSRHLVMYLFAISQLTAQARSRARRWPSARVRKPGRLR
jgi:hypothetical protein